MKIAIVYHSAGGNTRALAEVIASFFDEADLYRISEFDLTSLSQYDGLIIGTYTWGDGDMPQKMSSFYEQLEHCQLTELVTGVFGTGETNYNHFCQAVNDFRDMLYARSQLAVTLKIEQMYQSADLPRIEKFVHLFQEKLHQSISS